MKVHLESSSGAIIDTMNVEPGTNVEIRAESFVFPLSARHRYGCDCPRCEAYVEENATPQDPKECGYACEHTCTLIGHAHEAIRFLNQCLDHGITKTAVEGDPDYRNLIIEVAKMQQLLLKRIKP